MDGRFGKRRFNQRNALPAILYCSKGNEYVSCPGKNFLKSRNLLNIIIPEILSQEYGDLTIGKMKVAEFQGNSKAPVASNGRQRVSPLLDAVPSGDVPLEILRHKLRKSGSNEESSDIQRAIRGIEKVF